MIEAMAGSFDYGNSWKGRDLAFENLALRQQLGVLKKRIGVPRLKKGDRVFWVVLPRIWAPWVLANTTCHRKCSPDTNPLQKNPNCTTA
jgi:hypothetical protein